MPCEYAGFTLKPFGFFDRNPGIDLAQSASAHGGQCAPGQHGHAGENRHGGENEHG
jgi:primary-amine oxidase